MTSDEQRFHDFVAARYGALLRTAYALTANHHDAEDLLQASLVKAAAAWHRVGEQPEPYVRRILYHENISRWRRRRVDEHPTDVPPDRPAPGEPGSIDRVLVQRALARLTPKQRTVLVLRFLEDLTEQQTAELMGVRPGTVKSQTRYALARLREVAPELVWHDGQHAQRDEAVPHR